MRISKVRFGRWSFRTGRISRVQQGSTLERTAIRACAIISNGDQKPGVSGAISVMFTRGSRIDIAAQRTARAGAQAHYVSPASNGITGWSRGRRALSQTVHTLLRLDGDWPSGLGGFAGRADDRGDEGMEAVGCLQVRKMMLYKRGRGRVCLHLLHFTKILLDVKFLLP